MVKYKSAGRRCAMVSKLLVPGKMTRVATARSRSLLLLLCVLLPARRTGPARHGSAARRKRLVKGALSIIGLSGRCSSIGAPENKISSRIAIALITTQRYYYDSSLFSLRRKKKRKTEEKGIVVFLLSLTDRLCNARDHMSLAIVADRCAYRY